MEKHSFPLQEEATEQTPYVDSACLFLTLYVIQAAFVSSVKQEKQNFFPLESVMIQHFNYPSPLSVHSQKAAVRICSLLPESSCVFDKHRAKCWIKSGNKQTQKRPCSLSHHLHPEMKIPEQHTFWVAKNPVECDWCQIIQNRFSTMKGIISVVIKIQRYIFFIMFVSKFFFLRGTLWNKVPCADRYQCMPSLYSWKMHMSNSLAFPVHQVSKIFYKQIKCSNIYSWWKESDNRAKIKMFVSPPELKIRGVKLRYPKAWAQRLNEIWK